MSPRLKSDKSAVRKAHAALLCTNVFFAVNYSFIKFVSPSVVGPFALNIIRVALSIVLFWITWSFGKSPAGIQKKHIGRFLLCGLTGVAINQMFFIKGLTMTATIHATLLMLITPILVTVFAIWALKEQFSVWKLLGLALGVGGATLLILQKESSQHASNYLLGDLFIMINSISYAAYFILVKPLMEVYSPVHVIRWVFMFGLIMILPIGWNEFMHIEWSNFHWRQILALILIVVTGTFLAYYFNAYGIQNLGAGVAGAYIYTQPVFAVIIAKVFLHESFTWQKLLAAVLIFSGVYLVSTKKPVPERTV